MLIPNQLIRIKITRRNCEHYRNLGYDVQCKDIIMVPPEHLTIGSHDPVLVMCDVCGEPMTREYKTYVSHRKYNLDTCIKCKDKKSKVTNIERYGCENPMQSATVRDKARATMLDKYGVESPAQSEVVREKMRATTMARYGVEYAAQSESIKQQMKNTCVEKYGVPHFSQTAMYKEQMAETCMERYGSTSPFGSKEIQDKIKHTLEEKYGVDNASKIPEVREKAKQTMIEKYGAPSPLQADSLIEKIKNTNLNKYGVENPSSLPETRNKVIATCLKKYGVCHYAQTEMFKDKFRQTCLDRYGVEHNFKSPEIRAKILQTMTQNSNTPTSSQQLQIYEMIKKKYCNAELNHPFNIFSLDVFICINNIKIDIEYDGWYWHQDKHKDLRRDKVLQSQGFKILRIRSGTLLPTEQELFDAIDYLVNTEHHFKEIILSDWKEKEEEECQKQ